VNVVVQGERVPVTRDRPSSHCLVDVIKRSGVDLEAPLACGGHIALIFFASIGDLANNAARECALESTNLLALYSCIELVCLYDTEFDFMIGVQKVVRTVDAPSNED